MWSDFMSDLADSLGARIVLDNQHFEEYSTMTMSSQQGLDLYHQQTGHMDGVSSPFLNLTRSTMETMAQITKQIFMYHLFQPSEQKQDENQENVQFKTLVVLMGNLCGGKLAWNTLYLHVLDVNPHTYLALVIGQVNSPAQKQRLY